MPRAVPNSAGFRSRQRSTEAVRRRRRIESHSGVVNGIHLVERMKLDELAASGVYEFAFIVQPLKIQGATGSTVVPVAVY